MALCCIGGVCVPYTAIVPLLLLGLKWMASKLAQYGVLPLAAVKYLGLESSATGSISATGTAAASSCASSSSCCNAATAANGAANKSKTATASIAAASAATTVKFPPALDAPAVVQVLKEGDELPFSSDDSSSSATTTVLKFTAAWCGPCRAIAPAFADLVRAHAVRGIEADVDAFDDLAAAHGVAILPAFCIAGSGRVERYTGSDPRQLEAFFEKYLEKRA